MTEPDRGGAVVLGLGNPLMADDGLGLAALDVLRHAWTFHPAVELVDGGTWGMNLLPLVETSRRLVLLDAIDAGAEPGTLIELARADLPRFFGTKLSPHQIDLRDVLALAELRGTLPPDVVAIGLQPERVELSTELSPRLAARVPLVVERVIDRLRAWGYEPATCAAAAVHA